jgi:hypothetical protein
MHPHPYALRDEIELNEAAELLAHPDKDRAIISEWRRLLEEAIKSGDLPAHDAESRWAMPIVPLNGPVRGFIVPHMRKADLQRYCAKHGIKSPYEGLPTPPGALGQDIPSQRVAEFERYCKGLDDEKLFGWKKNQFLAELRRMPPFVRLKTQNSLDHFWRAARPVLKRIRAARRLDRKQ